MAVIFCELAHLIIHLSFSARGLLKIQNQIIKKPMDSDNDYNFRRDQTF